jgi:hypothetical protein
VTVYLLLGGKRYPLSMTVRGARGPALERLKKKFKRDLEGMHWTPKKAATYSVTMRAVGRGEIQADLQADLYEQGKFAGGPARPAESDVRIRPAARKPASQARRGSRGRG